MDYDVLGRQFDSGVESPESYLEHLGCSLHEWQEEAERQVEERRPIWSMLQSYNYLSTSSDVDPDLVMEISQGFRDRILALRAIWQLAQDNPEELAPAIASTFNGQPVLHIVFSHEPDPGGAPYLNGYVDIMKQRLLPYLAKVCEQAGWQGWIEADMTTVDPTQVSMESDSQYSSIIWILRSLQKKSGDGVPMLIIDGYGEKAVVDWGFLMHFETINRGGTTLVRASEVQSKLDDGFGSPWVTQTLKRGPGTYVNSVRSNGESPWVAQSLTRRRGGYESPWATETLSLSQSDAIAKSVLIPSSFAAFSSERFTAWALALEEVVGRIREGEMVGLQARQRSGKSTALRALARMGITGLGVCTVEIDGSLHDMASNQVLDMQVIQATQINTLIVDEAGYTQRPGSQAQGVLEQARQAGVHVVLTYPDNAPIPPELTIVGVELQPGEEEAGLPTPGSEATLTSCNLLKLFPAEADLRAYFEAKYQDNMSDMEWRFRVWAKDRMWELISNLDGADIDSVIQELVVNGELVIIDLYDGKGLYHPASKYVFAIRNIGYRSELMPKLWHSFMAAGYEKLESQIHIDHIRLRDRAPDRSVWMLGRANSAVANMLGVQLGELA